MGKSKKEFYKVFLAGPTCVCGPFDEDDLTRIKRMDQQDGVSKEYGYFTAEEYRQSFGKNVEDYL